MRSRELTRGGQTTWALVFSHGDEVVEGLLQFARERRIESAGLTAVGALAEATVGYFDWETKEYQPIPVREQVELLSMVGDIALKEDGEPQLHVHVVLGKRDGSTVGGHLLKATVRPTLEVILTEAPAVLRRRSDPESGLALIDLDDETAVGA